MYSLTNIIRRRLGSEDGQAFVEFALVIPILLTVVLAAVAFGDTYWKYQQLSAATSEGARTAIVSRNASDRTGTVVSSARAAAPNLDESKFDVEVSSAWTPGSTVTVTGRYPVKIDILGVTFFDNDLKSTRTMRVEQ